MIVIARNREDFLADFDGKAPGGAVFCPTRTKLEEGESVTVAVRVGRRQPPVLLGGRVAWRRTGKHAQKIRAGVQVEFADEERAKVDYVLDLSKPGDEDRKRRRYERLPIEIPVAWRQAAGTPPSQGVLRDIGQGGAFVSTKGGPGAAANDDLVLEVSPPGAQVAMAFMARVAWVIPSGQNVGFGVKWRARDAGGGRRIRELVRRLTAAA